MRYRYLRVEGVGCIFFRVLGRKINQDPGNRQEWRGYFEHHGYLLESSIGKSMGGHDNMPNWLVETGEHFCSPRQVRKVFGRKMVREFHALARAQAFGERL